MALTTRLPSTNVEPFYGFVETTGDALRLIQAARQGIIPRITRRLNDLERRAMIRSGSIFIFSDEESGIKRWTEGLSWSASRIVGNFLVYREVSDRSNVRLQTPSRRVSKRRINMTDLSPAELAEQKLSKSLVGCLNDNGRFKANGLIKKTITVNVEGSDHHLIAYYSQDDVRLGNLRPLSSRMDIMLLIIPPELLESTKFRVPPITEIGTDGRPRYICDADEGEPSIPSSAPFLVMPANSLEARAVPSHPSPTTTTYSNHRSCAVSSQHPYRPSISTASASSFYPLNGCTSWLPTSTTRSVMIRRSENRGVAYAPESEYSHSMRALPSLAAPSEVPISESTSPSIQDLASALQWNNTEWPSSSNSLCQSLDYPSAPVGHNQSTLTYTASTWPPSAYIHASQVSFSSLPSTPTGPRQSSHRCSSLPSFHHNMDSTAAFAIPPTIPVKVGSKESESQLINPLGHGELHI